MTPPKIYKTILFILFIGITHLLSAQGEFKLVASHKKSDIDYLTIKNINSLPGGYDAMFKALQPVSGDYTVYIFIKEFMGISMHDEDDPDTLATPFHDMIILKTNKQNEILDGYFYRLEWAEVPSQYMIFRSFAEGVKLTDKLTIPELNFLNEYEMYNFTDILEDDPEKVNEYGQRILYFLNKDILKF